MATGDSDITLLTVLQHMQAMEQRLIERIEGVRDDLSGRIDRLEAKVDHNHIQVTAQLDAIDRRLDDVEVVEIPKLKKAVGMK